MRPTGFLLDRFAEHREAPALVASESSCSFAELHQLVDRWTGELIRRGVVPGTVVGLEGDFSPETVALLLALADRQTIVVPHRPGNRVGRTRDEEIASVELRLTVDGRSSVHFEDTRRTASHPLYSELRARAHPGLVLFSSGSSGEPKAAVHDLTYLLDKFRVRRPALSTIAFLLFDHLGGLNTMLHALSNGALLVCPPDRSPTTVCELVEHYRVELLAATPTFYNLLLLSREHRRHDLSSLRVVSYGAEPMLQTTLDRLRTELPPGIRFQQTYGMVEVGAMRTRSREDGSLWVKIGGEGFETRVVDGVLQLRARSMLMGYLNAPVAMTHDGWLITGDEVDQDGEYVRFLGRASDVINVGGEKVHPTEIENVIQTLDGIADVVVRGEPNRITGQIVTAEVTPCEPADPAEVARRVKRHCRAQLEPFKVPVRVRTTTEQRIGPRHKKDRTPR